MALWIGLTSVHYKVIVNMTSISATADGNRLSGKSVCFCFLFLSLSSSLYFLDRATKFSKDTLF